VLAGNFMTTERITYRAVDETTGSVFVATDTNAIQRIARDAANTVDPVCRLFPVDRHLRLVDSARRETYVAITGCVDNVVGGLVTNVTITFANLSAPALPKLPGVCGVTDGNAGGSVNTVNVVEYSVQQISAPFGAGELDPHGLATNMASVVRWDGTPQGDGDTANGEDSRVDLLRRELDITGAVILNSGEVIADWVADFKLRARVANVANGTQHLDTGFVKGAIANPQRIRSVGVRLTTRSREPDREERTAVSPPPPIPDAATPLDRFDVFPGGANRRYRFARVRTMYSEVHLPNLAQASW
jgi:hypothetical protein